MPKVRLVVCIRYFFNNIGGLNLAPPKRVVLAKYRVVKRDDSFDPIHTGIKDCRKYHQNSTHSLFSE